ncbi:hypothetical protein HT031_003203 [Scenedesmus sp. PABB004]|nr:hypothetical protein HT031_003203 [Scenedesmus sp. PABB004]
MASAGGLASLRTHDGLGSPTAAAAAAAAHTPTAAHTPRTPGGGKRPPALAGPLFGAEVVGRKCSVLTARGGAKGWEAASVVDFSAESGQHRLRFKATKAEEWLCIGDVRLKWAALLPASAAANPTHRPELAREAAVGRRLRVYWPAMQKWYQGTVRAYDPRSDRHTIIYKDGDSQTLVLRHEPVVWCDDGDAPPPEPGAPAAGGAAGAGAGGAATTPRHSSSAGGAAATPAAAAAALAAAFTPGPQPKGAKGRPGAKGAKGAGKGAGKAALTNGSSLPGGKPGARSALGKHARDGGGAADSAAKRRRGAGRPGAAGARPAALAPIHDKHLAVGCRVGVYWRLDRVHYRGKLLSYSPGSGKYVIRYDDGQSEAIRLERERFVWHAPRASSAGYRPALHGLMAALGADGLQPLPTLAGDGLPLPAAPAQPEGTAAPPVSGADATGWRIQLYWPGDAAWHEAEVLSYDEHRRRHHVLYLDGEEEWADLTLERVAWLRASRHGAVSAGVVHGDDVPKARDAVGWRVSVYWKADRAFYLGEVLDYEPATGRHKVHYADGEEEWLSLRNERVVWRLPPRESSEEEDEPHSDDEFELADSEEEGEEELSSDDEELLLGGGPRGGRARGSKRGRRRGKFGARRRRVSEPQLRRGVDSDSASASSGSRGPSRGFAAAAGGADDTPANGDAGGAPPSAGGAAGAAPGAGVHPNLPPLQLRRNSGSGDVLGSPLAGATAEQLHLVVRIVPGGRGGAAKASTVSGVSSSGAGAGPSPAPGAGPGAQKVPPRAQRTAERLQGKVERLRMILGKLAATAGDLGWTLDPQLAAALPLPGGGAAEKPPLGPLSPRARAGAGGKAGGAGPTSPRGGRGPMSPRAAAAGGGGVLKGLATPVAAAAAPGGGAPLSPRGPASPSAAGPGKARPPAAQTPGAPVASAVKAEPGPPAELAAPAAPAPAPGSNGLAHAARPPAGGAAPAVPRQAAAAQGGAPAPPPAAAATPAPAPPAALAAAPPLRAVAAPALPHVAGPSAPSASLTADDVVMRLLQAHAAQQQQQQRQQQQAAAAAAAATPALGSGAAPMDTD